MSLKDILVHVDDRDNAAARLDTAIALASQNQAHLTGVYVDVPIEVPPYVSARIPPEVLVAQAKAHAEAMAHAKSMFESATKRAGVASTWVSQTGRLVESLSQVARYFDLVVVGQRLPEDFSDMPERFVLSVGRPVLVVPYAGKFAKIGQHVTIAWDASRLSARAVGDALSVLQAAKRVSVLSINPKSGVDAHGDVPGADIALHLARHGVKVTVDQAYANDIDAPDLLMSRMAEAGSDLLVMGAYGHSRWRELVLGGFTRKILQHMAVPVLMSH